MTPKSMWIYTAAFAVLGAGGGIAYVNLWLEGAPFWRMELVPIVGALVMAVHLPLAFRYLTRKKVVR